MKKVSKHQFLKRKRGCRIPLDLEDQDGSVDLSDEPQVGSNQKKHCTPSNVKQKPKRKTRSASQTIPTKSQNLNAAPQISISRNTPQNRCKTRLLLRPKKNRSLMYKRNPQCLPNFFRRNHSSTRCNRCRNGKG